MGPVHLISFSTEVYFYLEQGIHLVEWQYEWLENDLKVSVSHYNRMYHQRWNNVGFTIRSYTLEMLVCTVKPG